MQGGKVEKSGNLLELENIMTIGIFGAIGYDDIGDDALLISNIEALQNVAKKLIIFTSNLSKTNDLLKKHNYLPSHGISNKISVVESLDVYNSRVSNIFKYLDMCVDKISDNFFNTKLGIFSLLYLGLLKHLLMNCCKNKKVDNIELAAFVKNVQNCSFILFMGGGYLNKHWGMRIRQFLLTLDVARYLDKVIIASGLTIGPLSIIQKYLLKKRINYFKHIAVRDVNRSRKRLLELGVDHNRISEGPDDAIFLEKMVTSKYDMFEPNFRVITNFGGFLKYAKHPINCFYQEIASFLDELIKTRNAKIIHVSMDRSSSDYLRGIKIQQYMQNPQHMNFLAIDTDSRIIKFIISRSNLVISSRLHPIVFAIAEKIPFIGISAGGEYYDTKLKGITECYGYRSNEHIINVDEVSSNSLNKLLHLLLNEKPNDHVYEKNKIKRFAFLQDFAK